MNYKISDEVWHRVVQIIQEAMLTGVDCADLLRQVRLTQENDDTLTLTEDYRQQVARTHEKYLSEIEGKKNQTTILTDAN